MNPSPLSSPGLFTVDGMVGAVFLVMIAITLIGGLIACNSDRLVRCVAGLVVCFIGVAGLYFFLNSPFVSMMQILIYVGAVSVTISFAIMLAAPEEKRKIGPSSLFAGPLGFVLAGLVAGGFATLAVKTEWMVQDKQNDGSVKIIGQQLLTDHAMVFELVSVVLLLAIIGALVIARQGRNN